MEDIETLINNINDGKLAQAGNVFNSLIQDKLSDAIEQEKIAVASSMFGNGDEEQLEMDFDDDISDEELEDAAEEADEDE